jgi:hypothetical protein
MGARSNNRAAPAWPRASPYAPHTVQMSICFVLGEGWNDFREAKKDFWVDPQPVRRGSGGRENNLSGQANFLVLVCACVTLSGTRFVGLIRLRVSSTVTPSKACTPFQLERISLPESQRHQKEWRDLLNRTNEETHILCVPSFVVWPPHNHSSPQYKHAN